MIGIRYLGQCGFQVFSDDICIAIDPVLNELVENGNDIRLYPPIMKPEELEADYIFCTHEHIDHMAIPTLLAIADKNAKTKFVVPKGSVSFLTKQGISADRIIGIAETDEVNVIDSESGLSVKGVSTAHPIHQLDDRGLDHNLAYCLQLKGKSIVHLGDTYYTDRLVSSLGALGDIDVLFSPINGRACESEDTDIIGNMSSGETVKLTTYLKTGITIPMHFDMIKGNTVNPTEFVNELMRVDKEAAYWVPVFDEILEIE